MSKFIDLVGERFERLIVIKRMYNNRHRQSMWLCRCDCGKETIIIGKNLKNRNTKSCGCFNIEKIIIRSTKHGHKIRTKVSKIYIIWTNIIARCTNPNDPSYHNYGGRGIKVCKRWRNSFENFLEDMGEVPKGYQIDRINNNGNYCKSNCRWVSLKEQQRNKRNNHLVTHRGKTQCLTAWAEEVDIARQVLGYRLKHWTIKRALTTPVQKRRK